MRDVLVRLVNERYDEALATLRCPVELVWGDDDTEAPVEGARALASAPWPRPVSRCVPVPATSCLSRPPRPRRAVDALRRRRRAAAWPAGALASWPRRSTRGRGGVAACAVAIVLAGPGGCGWLSASTTSSTPLSRFALRWWTHRPGQPRRCCWSPSPGLVLSSSVAGSPRWPPPPLWRWDRSGCRSGDGPHRWPGHGGCGPWRWCGWSSRPAPSWAELIAGAGPVAAAAGALALPALVDLACVLTAPVERRLAATLRGTRRGASGPRVPEVVAITGLVRKDEHQGIRRPPRVGDRRRSWPARPASTTGPGWPAPSTSTWRTGPRSSWPRWAPTAGARSPRLCRWISPDVAVITAIGPVHLERFGSEEPSPRGEGRDRPRRRRALCSWSTTTGWWRWPTTASVERQAGVARVGPRRRRPMCASIDDRMVGSRSGSEERDHGARRRRRRQAPATWPRPWRWRLELGVDPATVVVARLPTLARRTAPARAVARRHRAGASCSTTPTTPTPRAPRRPGDASVGWRVAASRRVVVTPGDGRARARAGRGERHASPPRRLRWPPTWSSWAAPTGAPCCEGPACRGRTATAPFGSWCVRHARAGDGLGPPAPRRG